MNILKYVSTWLMLTLAASASQAGVITTTYQQVSGSDWYVDLHLMGDDIPTTPSGFTVYFDENLFSDLIAIATPDETWDTLVIQPDLNIPAPGFYDAYLTTGQGFAFHDATGFRVGFSYFGTDAPPQLTFDIVDANYQVLFSGVTKPLIDLPTTEVPEPNTIILLALGLLVISLKKKFVQQSLKRHCVFLSLLYVSFVSGSAFAATSSEAVVMSIAKVSEKRIDRTVFEYVFKVTVKNGDLPQNNIAATLLTVGKGSTIVDGSVSVENLVAGAIATPTDTITIRHDRIYPFDLAALVWRVGGRVPLEDVPITVKETTEAQHITLSTGITVAKSQLLVVTQDTVDIPTAKALFTRFGGVVVGHIPEAYTYQVEFAGALNEAALTQLQNTLSAQPGVLVVTFNGIQNVSSTEDWIPSGEHYADQSWGLQAMEAEAGWHLLDTYIKGFNPISHPKIGIIDSGFDYNHNDIKFAEIYGPTGLQGNGAGDPIPIPSTLDKKSIDYANALGKFNHGMNVAGIIGADGRNKLGIAGIAWQSTPAIYAVRTDYSLMYGLASIARLIKLGTKVINLSSGPSEQLTLKDAEGLAIAIGNLIQSLAPKHNFLVVFAAGNDSKNAALNTTGGYLFVKNWEKYNFYSTARSRLIYVGALSPGADINSKNIIAPYSNYDTDVVELFAPGGGKSCVLPPSHPYLYPHYQDSSIHDTTCSLKNRGIAGLGFGNNSTTIMHGTSMAAPMVTAAAALAWFINPELKASEVKNILLNSSVMPVTRKTELLEKNEIYPTLNLFLTVKKAITSTNNSYPAPAPINSAFIITHLYCSNGFIGSTDMENTPVTISPITATTINAGGPQLTTDVNGFHFADIPYETTNTYNTNLFVLKVQATSKNIAYQRIFSLPTDSQQNIRNINISMRPKAGNSCDAPDTQVEMTTNGLTIEPDQPNDQTVFSNYGPNNSFCTTCNVWNTGKHSSEQPYRRAMSFSVAQGSDIKLNSIRLSAYQSSDSVDATFLVSINEDANGLPGAELEKFTFSNLSGSTYAKPYLLTGESVIHPTLRAGQRYWITTQVSEPTTMHVDWVMNNMDSRDLVAWSAGSAPWSNPWGTPQVQGVFNVKGEPIKPENIVWEGFYEVKDAASAAKLATISAIKGSLYITNTSDVKTIFSNSLASVSGDLIVGQNASLTTLELQNLQTIGGQLNVWGNGELNTLSFKNLRTIHGQFYAQNNPKLNKLQLTSLEIVERDIGIQNNIALVMLELPALRIAAEEIYLSGNTEIEYLDLPSLISVGNRLILSNNQSLGKLMLSRLSKVGINNRCDKGFIAITGNTALSSLDFGQLQSIQGALYLSDSKLTTLGLFSLTKAADILTSRNPLLANSEIASLKARISGSIVEPCNP